MDWDANLRLRHIRCFLEVARAESVVRAASQLSISQPAVSKTLKELEDLLGVKLFDRVGRVLRLNEQGRIFQGHASASMIELMRARNRLLATARGTTRLSIGVLPTAAADLLPRAALAFRKDHPDARLHILTGPNWLLFNQLREGQVELVVGRMPTAENLAGLSFQQLYLEDVVLVARPGHPVLTAVQPEDHIKDYDLILPPPGAVIAATVERYLTSIGLPGAAGVFETVALPFARRVLLESDLLWFISRGVVADQIANGTLAAVNLGSPLLAGPVGISTSESAPLSLERSRLIDCLRSAARKIPGSFAVR